MKHKPSVTILLIALFFVSQLFGLFLVAYDATPQTIVDENNQTSVQINYSDTAIGERPEFERESGPLWYLLIGIAIATGLLLLLIRFRSGIHIWKAWYAIAVTLTISVTLAVFIDRTIALILAGILAYFKITKSGPILHNITELLMYAGIAFLFIPLFETLWVSVVLLLAISIYDMYAVWKSKHMIRLAKFTSDANLFAGLAIPYNATQKKKQATTRKQAVPMKDTKTTSKRTRQKQAILGGGDIVFPLLFAGSILNILILNGMGTSLALLYASIVPIITTIALTLLFYKGKKDRFYPAMPFLTAGCFVGFGVLQLILLLL